MSDDVTDEDKIEARLQYLGKNAPRLSPDKISATIDHAEYHVFSNKATVCCLTLKNGFTVIGESACVDPRNFVQGIGEEIAYRNARQKIWQLEEYLLQEREFHSDPDHECYTNSCSPRGY